MGPRSLVSACVRISGSQVCVTAARFVVTLDNHSDKRTYPSFERDGAATFECLPYQLSIVRYTRTMALTGNGESGFDSGEAA